MPPAEPRPALVVFDFDGTLVDSIGDLCLAVNRLVVERGGRPVDDGRVSRMVGDGARMLVARAFEAAGIPGDPQEALPRFLEIYDGLLPGRTRPYPGVPRMLADLQTVVPMAVLTNKPSGITLRLVRELDLARHFPTVIGGDGPFARKPDPAGLLHLAAGAGVAPADTLMVGDSTVDLLTARAAGTRICLVRYGFGFATIDRSRLRGDEQFAGSPGAIVDLVVEGAHAG
jgi:phosphoglycolate phosphatase